MKKRLCCIALVICMLVLQFALVSAAEIVKNGTCGDNLTWTFDETEKVLTISGTGDMTDYPEVEKTEFTAGYTGVMGKNSYYVEKIVIEEGVTSIGDNAFSNMHFMSDITIPLTVTKIGNGAFDRADIEVVSFADGNNIAEIGDFAFSDNSMLNTVDLSNCLKLEKIGASAFYDNDYLSKITLPESGVLKEIGSGAFSKLEKLTELVIPETVTAIGDMAFSDCKSLMRVYIPESVTAFGKDLFKNCASPTVYGVSGSAAEKYANENNIRFIAGGFDEVVSVFNGTCGENLTWVLDSAGTLTISGTGDMENFLSISYTPWQPRNLSVKKIVIEDGVTSIGKDAFFGMDNLESVVMADSVTVIHMGSFTGNKNLKSINLSKNLTTIGDTAFYSCHGLTELYIPEKVEIICDYTFYEPLGLTKFIVDENNPYFSSDDRGALFNKDKTVLIQYPLGNKETAYVVPKTVKSFAKQALHEAGNLTDLSFEEGSVMTEITENAFSGCTNLKNVVLPDSVTVIEGSTFRSCKSLETIKLPATLQKIGSGTFSQSGINNIVIPKTVTEIGESAFLNSEITSITIPDSVVIIGEKAFSQCTELETVNIGAGVTSISEDSLYYCTGLKKIEVSPLNTAYSSDEYGALYNKDKTVLIQYPCKSEYKEYTMPDTVTKIAESAFSESENLEKINLSSNLQEIGEYAFARTSISEISIPKALSKIDAGVFSGCKYLSKVNIPEGSALNSIGKQAFAGTAITEFDVPLSVTYIGSLAFGSCENLLRVTIPYGSELKTLGGNILGGPNTTFYIPEGSDAEAEAKKYGIKYTYTNEIKVMVDGVRVKFDQHPVIINDRTLVPMRAIFEALGAEVGWVHDSMTATAEKDGTEISIKIDSDVLMKNGEAVTLDSPATLVNNRTLVPVRAISEALGCMVEWKEETRTVNITK